MTARILIADGVATTRITLKVRLATACYEVLTAATPEQLIQQARESSPDLVILGGGFAQRGPVEICRALLADRLCQTMPVLMLADGATRLDALRAGAAAVLDPSIGEQMLLARIRGLLRDAGCAQDSAHELAEAPAGFAAAPGAARISLVADGAARALRWRHLLQHRLAHRFSIQSPEEALGAAATGQAADLYLIAVDIEGRGDGLRLLSELRSRGGSRDAAFVMATDSDRAELSAVALDLGAGEVLPMDLGGTGGVEVAALALEGQLSRKAQNDQRRAEARRNFLWAMTDPLTGLYNRRYALPRLTEIARDALRHANSFAVLVLDLDRFKRINDGHGHAAGDAVLCEVARRLEAAMHKDGITARLGGEEFLAVLCDADEARALRRAEEIRRAIEIQPVRLPDLSGGGRVQVTLSIGVAVAPCDPRRAMPDRLAELSLERADRALMMAKSMGRNRVMMAQTERAA